MKKRRKLKKKYKRLFTVLLLLVLGGAFWVKKATTPSTTNSTTTAPSTKTRVKKAPKLETTTYVQAVVNPENVDEQIGTNITDTASLYEKPTTDSQTISQVYDGEWLDYLGKQGEFYRVKTADNQIVYLKKDDGVLKKYSTAKTVSNLADLTVVLDPGHGGMDGGSVDSSQTVLEKTLTLKTAQAVQKKLTAAGVHVIMTRTKDDEFVKLAKISELANQKNANLLVSFHYDNYDFANQAEGFTTYYHSAKSKDIAAAIHTQLAAKSPLHDRGLQEANYMVLRNTYAPSILLELGYLNNDSDLAKMNTSSYRDYVAAAILKGLKTYYQLN